ncbi:MAG: 6-phosphofructokinase [Thermomicrobia bacterium]|nr:6-phosphofructokinase [Thermomicrobia bacterium]
MKNLLVFQSGGVTAVINASMVGVVREGIAHDAVGEIIGARAGIRGLLDDDLIDLRHQPVERLARVRNTPSAALGSTRHKPTDDDIGRALDALQRLNVGYVCPIGGNDSADTAHRLHLAAHAARLDINFVTVPKTIDNDLPHTDHTPIATVVSRVGWCVAVVPETLRDPDGAPIGGVGTYVDPFGHAYAASPVAALAAALERERGLRTRFDKPGTLARMMPCPTDLDEAEACGREAVRRAIAGESDRMVTIERLSDTPYTVRYGITPLSGIANIVRGLPDDFIAPNGRGVTDIFRRYALPLLGSNPFPPFGRLERRTPRV